MPFDDLDLEFEDEEESKKKKNDAFHVDLDLEFQSQENLNKAPELKVAPQAASEEHIKPAEVRKITEARDPGTKSIVNPNIKSSQQPQSIGSSALKMDLDDSPEAHQVGLLKEQLKEVQLEAKIKVAVAELKTELLVDIMSDMKLVDHQIGQLLIRISTKHPDIKNEALLIKKILADFLTKKRK